MACRGTQGRWDHRGPGSDVVRAWPLVRTKAGEDLCDQRLLQVQILFSIHVSSFVF